MGLIREGRDVALQGKLHAALDVPIGPDTRDDDLGLADAIDSALPLTDEAARLLRQAGAERQQQGKDSKDDPCISPSARTSCEGDISAAPRPLAVVGGCRRTLPMGAPLHEISLRDVWLMPSIPNKA